MIKYYVVFIRISIPNKEPIILHVAICNISDFEPSDLDLFSEAKNYLNTAEGKCELLNIIEITPEQYKKFFCCQTLDWIKN